MKTHPSGLKATRTIALVIAFGACPAFAADILRVNYDDLTPTGTFGFGFAGYGEPGGGNVDVSPSVSSSTSVEAGVGVAGTAGLRLTADTTATEAAIITPNGYSYMGFGIGTTAGSLLQPLPTANLARYKVDIAAAAVGLRPGVPQATCLVDVRFFAPDDTIIPADADTDGDVILTLRFGNAVLAKTAFQANSFRMDRPSEIREGSISAFNTYFASINAIVTVVEAGNAISDFGFDAGNQVILDNLTISESAPPPPPIETAIVVIDYDSNPRSYGGSVFAYAGAPDDGNSLPRTDEVVNGEGVGGSFAQKSGVDLTPWGPPYAVSSTYLGTINEAHTIKTPGLLTSPNLADYKVAADVRSSGYVSAPFAKIILQMYAPDDTLLPADDNTDPDTIVRLRFENSTGFSMPTTYLSISRNLADATFDDGTTAGMFAQHYAAISEYRFVIEPVGDPRSQFGFDNNNFAYMDNLKVLRLTPVSTLPVITNVKATAPTQFTLTFTSQPGNSYGIYRSINLIDFPLIATVPATAITTTYTRNQALIGKEFFRVADLGPTPAP